MKDYLEDMLRISLKQKTTKEHKTRHTTTQTNEYHETRQNGHDEKRNEEEQQTKHTKHTFFTSPNKHTKRLQSRILYMRMRSLNSRMKTPPLLTSPHASCLAGRTVAAAWLQPLTSGMHARCFSGVISDDLDQP